MPSNHSFQLAELENSLIVSCQAGEGDSFRDPESMARFAQTAILAGASGIRANGVDDIHAIRRTGRMPIIGIQKATWTDGRVLITPTLDDARALIASGADMVALDCTARGRSFGAIERLRQLRQELGVPVLADIATVEEAVMAEEAGADAVLSTLRGYTAETESVQIFEADFIEDLVSAVSVPVIAEGRIHTPADARAAMEAGAFAVVVGSAITRPTDIARRFVLAVQGTRPRSGDSRTFIGIDLGGTNTKTGLVSATGMLQQENTTTTPAGGRDVLLAHLKNAAQQSLAAARKSGATPTAVGIATAGWVDPARGNVVYATENLPGWTGTRIAEEVGAACELPVAVENDANALAVAEKHFGAGRKAQNFVCITLGTGVGGGCYIGGQLNHGTHFFANAIGHMPLVTDGLPCTCGLNGCLEVYANAAALVRYADAGGFQSAEAVIAAANGGNDHARAAIRTLARHLAVGCAAIVQLLDPELIVLSGGVAQDNPLLQAETEAELTRRVTVPRERSLRIVTSTLGYHGGVLGAAAVAMERLHSRMA